MTVEHSERTESQLRRRPTVLTRMSRLALIFSLTLTCLLGLAVAPFGSGSASARVKAKPATSNVVVTHWHRVASDLTLYNEGAVAATGNHYLALMTAQNTLALLNTSTNRMTALAPPNCLTLGLVSFGGPWLGVGCSVSSTNASGVTSDIPFVDLLDLSTGQWTARLLDPSMCDAAGAGCAFNSVGSTWIRITIPPFDYHDPQPTYLQNIFTGAVQEDMFVSSTGPAQDNLNNASGVSHPCVPVITGSEEDDFLETPTIEGINSYFTQLGRFVLTTGVDDEMTTTPNILQACGSKTRTKIPEGFVATNKLVLWPQSVDDPSTISLLGVSLPALRPFQVKINKGQLVAASNTTLYETTVDQATDSATLWATTVPNSNLTKNASSGS